MTDQLPTKTIDQLKSGLVVGYVQLGMRSGQVGTVKLQIHDGDTISARAPGNFGVRMLGVDAPEISFELPGQGFRSIGGQDWAEFLDDPFAAGLPRFRPALPRGLRSHLAAKVGGGSAANHHRHALAAEDALEKEVEHDLAVLGQSRDRFVFFLAFAYEVMDRYGRFLCYVNRNQPDAAVPEPRPRTYNERLLAQGMVCPYFIWPNLDPFLEKLPSVVKAVIPPQGARRAAGSEALGRARADVRRARERRLGMFEDEEPLRLQPFELRFLARRQAPDRWVIDLGRDDDVLIPPTEYYTVTREEDRLFVPGEHVPLFVERGWRRG